MRFSGFDDTAVPLAGNAPDAPRCSMTAGGIGRPAAMRLLDREREQARNCGGAQGKTCLGVLCDGSLTAW